MLYVPNVQDGTVSVMEDDHVVETVTVGNHPYQAAVDAQCGLVYVTTIDGGVAVLRGTETTPVGSIAVGTADFSVAVEPGRHLAYVGNAADNTVSVIRGTQVVATLDAPVSYDQELTVDPVTGLVLSVASGTVTTIDGTRIVGSVPVGSGDAEIPAVDTRTRRAFVSTDTTMLSLRLPALSRLTVGRPQRHHVYHRGTAAKVRYRCRAGVNNTVTACRGSRSAERSSRRTASAGTASASGCGRPTARSWCARSPTASCGRRTQPNQRQHAGSGQQSGPAERWRSWTTPRDPSRIPTS